MALNIKDPEVDRLARELATATGESITDSARKAFAERLERVRAQHGAADAMDELLAISARGRQRSVMGNGSQKTTVTYDEHGLPN